MELWVHFSMLAGPFKQTRRGASSCGLSLKQTKIFSGGMPNSAGHSAFPKPAGSCRTRDDHRN